MESTSERQRMGKLHEAVVKIEQVIRDRSLDPCQTRGAIGLRAGFVLSLVNADTPDDPVKLEKLRRSTREILKVEL